MRVKLSTLFLLAVALGVAIYSYYTYRVAHEVKFESLDITDLEGKPIDLGDITDEHLFVHFFATWCGNCLNEQASLEAAAEILKSDGVTTILISDEPIEKLKQFVANENLKTPIYHSNKKLKEMSIYTIPTCYLLKNNGSVVFTHVGEEMWNDHAVLNKLRALLR